MAEGGKSYCGNNIMRPVLQYSRASIDYCNLTSTRPGRHVHYLHGGPSFMDTL